MVRALLATLFVALAIGTANSEAVSANITDNTKLEECIMHSRAFETVIWSVPPDELQGHAQWLQEGVRSQLQRWMVLTN